MADSPLGYWRLGGTIVPPSAATASSTFSFSSPANAIDADGVNVWVTNGVVAAWLRLQYPTPVTLTQYKMRREDNATYTPRMPKDWTFEGSNDGTSWTVLDTRAGVTWPTVGETKSFSFSNSTAYTYYRINVTANNGDPSYTQINELITLTAADSSGNGREMIPVGTMTPGATGLIAAETDPALSLAGAGHLRTLEYASWMSPAALTVEALIQTTSTALMSIVDRDESSARAFQFRLNAGKLEFITINGGAGIVAATDTTSIADGQPHHVAATYDASNIRLYVGGSLTVTQAAVGALSTQGAKLSIGANFSGGSASARFTGTLDEIGFYGSALSGTRLAAHAAARSFMPKTVGAYWGARLG
jgi:hypothetical protein